jgi:hypothetical protein
VGLAAKAMARKRRMKIINTMKPVASPNCFSVYKENYFFSNKNSAQKSIERKTIIPRAIRADEVKTSKPTKKFGAHELLLALGTPAPHY